MAGYHYRAHTGCTVEVATEEDHAPLIGYAVDGYGLCASHDEAGQAPTDLDANGGHSDAVPGYHYHVGEAGSNAILNGLRGEYGFAFDEGGLGGGAWRSGGRCGRRWSWGGGSGELAIAHPCSFRRKRAPIPRKPGSCRSEATLGPDRVLKVPGLDMGERVFR